jgi:hypothetical protein
VDGRDAQKYSNWIIYQPAGGLACACTTIVSIRKRTGYIRTKLFFH